MNNSRAARAALRAADNPVRLVHRGDPLAAALDDFKQGVPGAGARVNALLGGRKRGGRRREV